MDGLDVGRPAASPEGQRHAPRNPVLKLAKILFQGSAVDCLVLDISPTGLRVSTQTMFQFPEQVRIELKSGAVYAAVRCWQRGMEAGFGFKGLLGLCGSAAVEARQLHQSLCRSGVQDVTARLAHERYFDHPELKGAAGAVDAAVRKLEQALLRASTAV